MGPWTLDMDIGPTPQTNISLVTIMTNQVIITTMIISTIIVMVIIIIVIIVIVVIIVGDQGPPISSQVTVLTAFPTVGGSESLQMRLDQRRGLRRR